MKKFSTIIMAIALVLGLSQCKKQETPTGTSTEDGMVYITVNVENGGGRHHIEPSVGAYIFTNGDILYVGDGDHYIGSLSYSNGAFTGGIDEPLRGKYLHFYFLGGKGPQSPSVGTESFTIDIADQSNNLPLLAYGCSAQPYTGPDGPYSTTLRNKCALVKFELEAGTTNTVTVAGMLTEATINFGNTENAIVPTATEGTITLYSESETEKWAILLPQGNPIEFIVNIGSKPYAVSGSYTISNNGFINSGIVVENAARIGSVMGLDGNYYDSVDEAMENGTYALAVVVYKGEDCTLAISVNDFAIVEGDPADPYYVWFDMSWDNANTLCASNSAYDGVVWRLPTEEEWQKMIFACGGQGYGDSWDCSGLMRTIYEAVGYSLENFAEYWTSTELDGGQVKTIRFEGEWGYFGSTPKDSYLHVRPVIQIGGIQPVTPEIADVRWDMDFSCDQDNPEHLSGGIKAEIAVGYRGEAYWNNFRLKLQSGDDYVDIIPSSLTFTSYIGNISKIVIYGGAYDGDIPSGWSIQDSKLTWEGTPAQSVTMMSSPYSTLAFNLYQPSKVEFYLEQNNK